MSILNKWMTYVTVINFIKSLNVSIPLYDSWVTCISLCWVQSEIKRSCTIITSMSLIVNLTSTKLPKTILNQINSLNIVIKRNNINFLFIT